MPHARVGMHQRRKHAHASVGHGTPIRGFSRERKIAPICLHLMIADKSLKTAIRHARNDCFAAAC